MIRQTTFLQENISELPPSTILEFDAQEGRVETQNFSPKEIADSSEPHTKNI